MATTITPQQLPPPSPRGHTFSTCASAALPFPPRGHKFLTCVSPVVPSPPRGHKFLTCVSPALPSPRGGNFSTCRIRSAFTLVELLVVIVILAMLASLVTMAASRAMTAARNAAIKAEIDMLHMAIMNYKNEYGSFPPSSSSTIAGSPAYKHLLRLFNRASPSDVPFQLQCLPYLNIGSGSFPAANAITPDTALVAWLYGFNDDPRYPVLSTNGAASLSGGNVVVTGTVQPRAKLFDFDRSRISTTYQYCPAGKPESPYVIIFSGTATWQYGSVASPSTFTVNGDTYTAETTTTPTGQVFFNADSFQILCAGRDGVWGPTSDDDLSNFWPGTRKDYLDSLNQ
jgi:prepilin-type N-terminal cleavage/methylation domain-containing protein